MSLGKINYCLNELKKKGLIKLENFKNNKNNWISLFTNSPWVKTKMKLTLSFMKQSKEFDELKKLSIDKNNL